MIKLPFKVRYEIVKEHIESGDCPEKDKAVWVEWVLSQNGNADGSKVIQKVPTSEGEKT